MVAIMELGLVKLSTFCCLTSINLDSRWRNISFKSRCYQ